jgi:hypothetical protein
MASVRQTDEVIGMAPRQVSVGVSCPICDMTSMLFDHAVILGKYEASYLRCDACGLVFAADPHWLSEAYEESIASSDIGLIARNLRTADVTTRVLRIFFPKSKSFVDFGAGNGMLVRLMRDFGYEFGYYDPYGPNLFARGHETHLGKSSHFDVGTAFEVLEHLRRPVDELRPLAASCDVILATTTVAPEPPPRLNEWWYYALDSGQHVTVYTERALDELARRLGYYRTSAAGFHVLARTKLSPLALRVVVSRRVGNPMTRLCRRRSLLGSDFEQITGRPLR